ncbi:MAG: prolyl oligopeptidase family serine peptidase [Novosphingobium sp.]|nr:prolyl oligopeptidase family serine peptidase [Novosphingobium sp.]
MLARLYGFLASLALLSAPAWAADDPPPLEAYGDLPGVEDMAISPDGQSLAMVTRVKDRRMLLVSGEGGSMRSAQGLGDTKVRALRWAGNDLLIVTTSVTENLPIEFLAKQRETFGAIIINLANDKTEMVFENRNSIGSAIFNSGAIRQIDGKWLGYFKGLEFKKASGSMKYTHYGSNMALFAVDLAKNRPSKVVSSKVGNFYQGWLVDGEGKIAAELEVNRTNGQWVVKNANRATLASGIDPTGDVSLISLGRNGSSAIYGFEDDESEYIRYFEVPLSGGTPVEILDDVRIDGFYVDRSNGRLLGYLDDGAKPRPVLYDPAHQAVYDKLYKAFSKYDITVIDRTSDFKHFIVLTSGNGDSGTYYLVDIEQLKADSIGFERVAIPAKQVGPISTVEYKAADGLDLDGILTLPPGREAKNLPVIMFPHGGPSSHDKETFDWWAQAFASRRYAVFQPNFRGSTNRDDTFRRAGYGQWGLKMQTDISDGLTELVKQGIADPARACIMGASYGGYAALAGVTLQQGLYRCSVAVAPVSDLSVRYNNFSKETARDKMTLASLRESMGDPSGFNAVSPRRFASRADAPVLLIHGKDDTVVDFEHSRKMADALKGAGKPYKLVVLRDEDHWLSTASTRKQMLEEAMRFVQQHNPAD